MTLTDTDRKTIREALRFYANAAFYVPCNNISGYGTGAIPVDVDGGSRARAALAILDKPQTEPPQVMEGVPYKITNEDGDRMQPRWMWDGVTLWSWNVYGGKTRSAHRYRTYVYTPIEFAAEVLKGRMVPCPTESMPEVRS